MKKIHVFLLIIISSITSAFGQVHEYLGNTTIEYESLFLTLCNNNYYIFGFRVNYMDIFHEIILSDGFYKQNHNDTIVLNDQVNGYELIFIKDQNNDLHAIKGFCFMDNLKLIDKGYSHGVYDSSYYVFDTNHSLEDLLKEQEKYRNQTVLHDFRPGVYEIARQSDNQLIINIDKTYSYQSKNELLSEGIWKRDGNLLIFIDKCLGEFFTAFIENDYIMVKHIFYFSNNEKFQIFSE